MAWLEDVFKGNIGTSLAVGVGVAVVGPILAPIVGGIVRPVAKAAIKAGMVVFDAGREGVGRLNEMSGDIVAEARSELDETRSEPIRRPATAASGPGGKPS
jgi:Protein of unknown function (DUF5132)